METGAICDGAMTGDHIEVVVPAETSKNEFPVVVATDVVIADDDEDITAVE